MSSYLFVAWDGGGNLTPTLGLARQLAARGHDVRLLGHRSIAERCGQHGWEYRAFTRTADLDATTTADNDDDEFAFLVEELMFSAAMARDVDQEVRRSRPDVLIVDAMLLAALAVGEAASVPTVALFHTAFAVLRGGPFVEALAPSLPLLNAARAELGLAAISDVSQSHDACERCLVTSYRELEPPVPVPANVRFVGPVIDAPPLMAPTDVLELDRDEAPLVLVTMSTSWQRHLEPLQRILDALATLPVRAVVTTGPAIAPADLVAAPNAHVVRYIPHDDLLPHAALVLTHAGLGTITRAIRFGVPVLCMPLGRDQHFNATRVVAVGVGAQIDAHSDIPTIGTAIRSALDDDRLRVASASLADRVTTYPSPAEITDELERLAAH